MIHHSATIHPKAHVESNGVIIGAGTKVWQFASVTRGTVLGEDCSVAPCAVLDGPVFGDRCRISPGVHIGPGFRIGNDVFLGANVILCNDMWPSVDKEGFDVDLYRTPGHESVIIGDRVAIGVNAVILPGVMIGDDCVIAAGSVVGRSIPPGMVVKPNGYTTDVIPAAQRRMRRMRFAKGGNPYIAARAAAKEDGTIE